MRTFSKQQFVFVVSVCLLLTLGIMNQANGYSAQIGFEGLDLSTGTVVQQDPTILIIVRGVKEDVELEQVLKSMADNWDGLDPFPDADLFFVSNPITDEFFLFTEHPVEFAMDRNTSFEELDGSILNQLDFQPLNIREMVGFELKDVLIFKTPSDILAPNISRLNGMSLIDDVKFLSSIPEPSSLLLLALGLIGLLGFMKRQRNLTKRRKYTITLVLFLIIVGMTNTAFALSDFNIGEIPPQTAYYEYPLEFQVHSDELGVGAMYSMNVINSPTGSVEFDASTREFRYAPDTEDKIPFSVTFRASANGKTVSQTVTITPVPQLPAEFEAFGLEPAHAIPNPENKDYIIRNEILSDAKESFNHQMRRTRTISISGKKLVFQQGHTNGLYDYHENEDIKAMAIHAETLIIRSPLNLPQTNVTIYARELRFEETGHINTTPRSLTTRPEQFQNGAHGLKAGDITLHIESFHSDPGYNTRFILRGGNGQPAGLGQDGQNGVDVSIPNSPLVSISPWSNNITYLEAGQYSRRWPGCWGVTYRAGDKSYWPGNGTDAKSAGKPGNGGNAGNIWATLEVTYYMENSGGIAGEKAPDAIGGRAGLPNPAYRTRMTLQNPPAGPPLLCGEKPWQESWQMVWVEQWRKYSWWQITEQHTSQLGAVAPAPEADISIGQKGTFFQGGNSISWLSPYALKMTLAYAKDVYLYGYLDEAEAILAEYISLLDNYTQSEAWNTVSERWQLEFGQMQTEMQTLQHRIASNLDYFGNPAGWVPMLSFEANKAAFEKEIDHAIRVLYLTYWVKNAASDIQKKVNALTTAREKTQEEIEGFKSQYNEAMDLIPGLQVESINIANQVEYLRERLKQRKEELLRRAEQNVEERHKLPFWKKALNTLGAICGVFPIGQPVIGAVGAGLSVITNIEQETPWSLIEKIGAIKTKDFENYGKNCATLGDAITALPKEVNLNTIKEYVKNISDKSRPVIEHVKKYQDIFKETQIPEGEVKKELERIKAADPEFNELADEIAKLLAQKDVFSQKTAKAMQLISLLSNDITHNLLALDALNRDITAGNAVLDHRAMLYLQEMEYRARERLLKYHYYMAKAYEYRLLQPYTGELNLTRLLDKFREIADTANASHYLSSTDFNALKALYEEQLSTIAEEIFDAYNSNRPELSAPFRFNLSQEEILQLNMGETVTLNLVERFPFSDENIRIVDFKVIQLDAHITGGAPVSWGFMDLYMEHSGKSKLRSDGRVYQFRHYNENTDSPIVWGTRYDPYDGSLNPIKPSVASQSLLGSLLSRAGIPENTENLLLYSRPAAWADIFITRETHAPYDIVIDNLRLEVTYDFVRKPSYMASLNVEISDDLSPLVVLSQQDMLGRQDGVGNFSRTFPKYSVVTLKAPARYYTWQFGKWLDRSGNELSSKLELQVTLNKDLTVYAHYTHEPNSTSLIIKQGAAILQNGSLYDFGTTNIGEHVIADFSIENPGSNPVSIHSIDMPSVQFSVDIPESSPFIIESGNSATFSVTFEPTQPEAHVAAISIITDNSEEMPYTLTLTGIGAGNGSLPEIVYVSANEGNDSNSGEENAPVRTIQRAIDLASSEDTVKVLAGTYAENIVLKEGIKLVGDETAPETVVIDGTYSGIVVKTVANNEVRGFKIINSKHEHLPEVDAGVFINDSSVVVKHNIFIGNYLGVRVEQTGSPLIVNNTFYNNVCGIYARGVQASPIVKNNISVFNEHEGIVVYHGATVQTSYNNMYGNGWANWRYVAKREGDIEADPLFVDATNHDLHLLPTSPSIDAGDPANDYSLEPGANGNRVNQGAYGNTTNATIKTEGPLLIVKKAGTGNGLVMVGEQVCDVTCSTLIVPFSNLTTLVLKAEPAFGSSFVGFEDEQGNPLNGIIYTQTHMVVVAVFADGEVTITDPQDDGIVENPSEIRGTYSAALQSPVWAMICPSLSPDKCYPQSPDGLPAQKTDGTWTVPAWFGGPSQSYSVDVYTATPEASQMLSEFMETCIATGNYQGLLKADFPAGLVKRDSITVHKTSTLGEYSITEPQDGGTVNNPYTIRGTYPMTLQNEDLWVMICPEFAPEVCFPQSPDGSPADKENNWYSVPSWFGGPPQSYDVVLYSATSEASKFLSDVLNSWISTGVYTGLLLTDFPDGLTEHDRVRVYKLY